ncbi:AraC family transcriptional regulator [Enterovibrio norvegicus]|uniref:AraC family transcriptional regulator n=1 Tax=Enterovibrio norvegicus TaxID=188144 RepID=A0ABV4KZY6_9GAMM
MENVGYRNLSNFNRQFKQYKQLTPREYRAQFKRGAS